MCGDQAVSCAHRTRTLRRCSFDVRSGKTAWSPHMTQKQWIHCLGYKIGMLRSVMVIGSMVMGFVLKHWITLDGV